MEPNEREWVYWMLIAHGVSSTLRRQFRQQQPADVGEFLRSLPEWRELEPLLTREALVLSEFLQQGGQFLTLYHSDYPERLRSTASASPPPVLYALGDISLLTKPLVAIAGSRNASQEAQEITPTIVQPLVAQGYGIITGFARGIDLIAGQAALDCGGITVGVLPHGLLNSLTQRLAREWHQPLNEDRLLFLSETHPKAQWKASFAMMRNRIVAGLAEFVVIIESGARESLKNGKPVFSGTYQCAEVAHKMGRPVYVLNLPAPGNQDLLRSGIAQEWHGLNPHQEADNTAESQTPDSDEGSTPSQQLSLPLSP
ncbi:MAG: DNA-processing protein DprA [Fimbriimonadales bacterium]